jgi:hypothetical protein
MRAFAGDDGDRVRRRDVIWALGGGHAATVSFLVRAQQAMPAVGVVSVASPGTSEIETVDERVDRSHRVLPAHIIVERCREQRALPAVQPFNKALQRMPRQIAGNLIARITSNRAFSHGLGQFRTDAPWQNLLDLLAA